MPTPLELHALLAPSLNKFDWCEMKAKLFIALTLPLCT